MSSIILSRESGEVGKGPLLHQGCFQIGRNWTFPMATRSYETHSDQQTDTAVAVHVEINIYLQNQIFINSITMFPQPLSFLLISRDNRSGISSIFYTLIILDN